MKESGKRSPAADSLVNLVDKKLEKEAKLVGEAITKFEVVSKNVLQKFNKVHILKLKSRNQPGIF